MTEQEQPDDLELEDARMRDAAVTDDDALVAYEKKWTVRLAKMQRTHPQHWHVPGLSDAEVRDELTLRLIEAVRTKPDERARHRRAGKEWGLLFLASQRRELRRAFKLRIVLDDVSAVLDRSIDEEEVLIERDTDRVMTIAREHAERDLSRPLRRWFAAMKLTANAGAFFESSGRLNLAAASRVLDKNRSSALRAFGELQNHFGRALEKVER